jgi:hypothetical protein
LYGSAADCPRNAAETLDSCEIFIDTVLDKTVPHPTSGNGIPSGILVALKTGQLDFYYQPGESGIRDNEVAPASQHKKGAGFRLSELQRTNDMVFGLCLDKESSRTPNAQSCEGCQRYVFPDWQNRADFVHGYPQENIAEEKRRNKKKGTESDDRISASGGIQSPCLKMEFYIISDASPSAL